MGEEGGGGKRGGGARPHFHPPFSRPSFKQSRTALIDHGEGGGGAPTDFKVTPKPQISQFAVLSHLKKRETFKKKKKFKFKVNNPTLQVIALIHLY